MPQFACEFNKPMARVVGCIGDAETLATLPATTIDHCCDFVELRLDLLGKRIKPTDWKHLCNLPLLMTARREDEGGARGFDHAERFDLLESALADAALVDLEVASIPLATGLIRKMANSNIPWVASFHDFKRMPENQDLRDRAAAAKGAGATIFKVAAMIHTPCDLARLADFQMADHGIPIATMGMGPMAVVSRLLCAQCGSVLNYGYLGAAPTAPGQWSAAEMKSAITRLPCPGG